MFFKDKKDQLEFVKQNGLRIRYIDNPSYDVVMYVIDNFTHVDIIMDQTIIDAIRNNDKVFLLLNIRNENLVGFEFIKSILKGRYYG